MPPDDASTPFHRKSVQDRLSSLSLGGANGQLASLDVARAERMIENVIGVFSLPYAVAIHLLVDGKERRVPMAVEEASIVAALCSAAKVAKAVGGFQTENDESLLAGQIQLTGLANGEACARDINDNKQQWIEQGNALAPRLHKRGGGVVDIEAAPLALADGSVCVRVHVYVDTKDAMGANTVNTLCEALAPALVARCGAQRSLSILSNLTERSLYRARVKIPVASLARHGFTGQQVRDGIVSASDFAWACPHRAVTHNKGIMNGIDAVAVATGNDWRAMEANAHAWAGRADGYKPLSRWSVAQDGSLCGMIELPLKVGTRGGNFSVNPSIAHSFALLGADDADTLARVMAATGLAQNFAALRALGTEGIQRGHMSLHVKSVVASANIAPERSADVMQIMLREKRYSVAEALSIDARLCAAHSPDKAQQPDGIGAASGKVLLFGEHAVVYGAHAIALPLGIECQASVYKRAAHGVHLFIPAWQIDARLEDEPEVGGVHHSLHLLLAKLGLLRQSMHLAIEPRVPRGMGLGSSAALAVAVVRALSDAFALRLSDDTISQLAFEAEKVAHATPSGVDNALATKRQPLLFQRGEPPSLSPVRVTQPLEMVIGLSPHHQSTATMVRRVRAAREQHPALYDEVFARIDALALAGREALARGQLAVVGKLMNLNHGLLHALDLSTSEVEDIVLRARGAGALGAKLTGGGGGGAVVALCAPSTSATVSRAIAAGHYEVMSFVVPTTHAGAWRDGVDDARAV